MTGTRLFGALVALAVVAGSTGGCSSRPANDAPAVGGETTREAGSGGRLVASGLPTEPGYAWDIATYQGVEPLPASITVAGPWTLDAGDDWAVSTTTIAEPADVPEIDAFDEFDYVVTTEEDGATAYFPRRLTDEWMTQLGRIMVPSDGAANAEVYAEPLRFWPLDFEVGEEFLVTEGSTFRVDATVLAQGTAVVPAGTIDDAYLLRFEYTPVSEGGIEGTHYYILAPDVGFVALFSAAEGDEASGITALESCQVLLTLPEKR